MRTNKTVAAVLVRAAVICAQSHGQSPSAAPIVPPNEIIYLPQLPSAAQLTSSAKQQGLMLASIQHETGKETVTYRLSNGQLYIAEYRFLPTDASAGPSAMAPALASTTPAPATSSTLYQTIPVPDYYDYPAAYCPWGWYAGGYWGGFYGNRLWGGRGFRRGGFYGGGGFRRGNGFHGGGSFHGGGGHR